MRARREVARLQAAGLSVDLSRANLMELGWALAVEDVPTPDEQILAQLDQVKQRNRVERQELERSPEESVRTAPDLFQDERQPVRADGHGDSAARAQDRTPGRKRRPTINDFLKESHDEHEEWS
jgi:hypothetical protein